MVLFICKVTEKVKMLFCVLLKTGKKPTSCEYSSEVWSSHLHSATNSYVISTYLSEYCLAKSSAMAGVSAGSPYKLEKAWEIIMQEKVSYS